MTRRTATCLWSAVARHRFGRAFLSQPLDPAEKAEPRNSDTHGGVKPPHCKIAGTPDRRHPG